MSRPRKPDEERFLLQNKVREKYGTLVGPAQKALCFSCLHSHKNVGPFTQCYYGLLPITTNGAPCPYYE